MTFTLEERLRQQFPILEDRDFSNHRSDLYVVLYDGVLEWLKANYQFPQNITTFLGNKNAIHWNGAGKLCADIPFEYAEYWSMK